jgi:hypothetical protein
VVNDVNVVSWYGLNREDRGGPSGGQGAPQFPDRVFADWHRLAACSLALRPLPLRVVGHVPRSDASLLSS